MKKYTGNCETYLCGATAEIKAVYKSIARAGKFYFPGFGGFPQFSDSKRIYAICLEDSGRMTVMSSDTMLDLIVSGDAVLA